MMRSAALLAILLIASCERPPPEPRPDSNTPGFDNIAASQSIMQPEVAAENPPEPTPSATPTPAPPHTVTILFAHGTALDDAGRAALDDLVATLPSDARLVVRGHSDAKGSDTANLLQSRRRAAAVRTYLADKGVALARMEVIPLGERRPVAPNAHRDGSDDPAGRARNRRADIEVLPPAPTPTPMPTPSPATSSEPVSAPRD